VTVNYQYQEAVELRVIEQAYLPQLEKDRIWTEWFPIEETDGALVAWDQTQNFAGTQQIRGVNGDPPVVQRIGQNRFQMAPGYYGEYVPIDEEELTKRAEMGQFQRVIPIDDLIGQQQVYLMQRELDLMETIVWNLCSTGTFSVASLQGNIANQDAYAIQLYTAAVTWGTSATATPLANFRSAQLLSRGYSVSFGAGAKAYMNRTTLNQLLSNTNTNDIAGRRVTGLVTVLSLGEINEILTNEDLPTIVPYDRGYYTGIYPNLTFNLFIPNNKVVVVGKRPNNSPVGSYMLTRNINDLNGAGRYTKIVDTGAKENEAPPRKIGVHRGHNGGPAVFFPSALISMSC
jgi:Phage major capsid protein E